MAFLRKRYISYLTQQCWRWYILHCIWYVDISFIIRMASIKFTCKYSCRSNKIFIENGMIPSIRALSRYCRYHQYHRRISEPMKPKMALHFTVTMIPKAFGKCSFHAIVEQNAKKKIILKCHRLKWSHKKNPNKYWMMLMSWSCLPGRCHIFHQYAILSMALCDPSWLTDWSRNEINVYFWTSFKPSALTWNASSAIWIASWFSFCFALIQEAKPNWWNFQIGIFAFPISPAFSFGQIN